MKKTGFSLIELMISLIIISIITAAFSPVVTKKLKASGAAYIASGGSASTTCTAIQPNGDCKLCTKNANDGLCLLCEATCTKGQYLDYDQCTCKSCSDTNCEFCSEKECLKCKSGYDIDPLNKTCVVSCNDKDLLRIGDLCVTKYNMGDKQKFPIPDTVKMFRAGEKADIGFNDGIPLCWYGITGFKDKCDSANGSYSGCGRTVCNWYAAREICSKLKLNGVAWRLPTIEETESFWAYSVKLKNEGLQLCHYGSNNENSTNCNSIGLAFKDRSQISALAEDLWTDTQYVSGGAMLRESYNGKTRLSKGSPASVRCVQGGYPDISKECTISDSNCTKCSSDGTACIECINGFHLESDGICWKTCSSGEYARHKTTYSQECVPCPDTNCKICKNETGACTSCISGFYAHPTTGECQPCGDFNMYTTRSSCSICNYDTGCTQCSGIGYIQKNAGNSKYYCYDCPTYCTACGYLTHLSKLNCTACASGHTLVNGPSGMTCQ